MSSVRYSGTDNFPPVVKNLIIINVLVYIAQISLHNQFQLTEILALRPVIPEDLYRHLQISDNFTEANKFKPYQVITHMFAHAIDSSGGGLSIFHILFNMFGLWMFGRVLENVWGGKRFLIFYLVCGIGAAALHLVIQYFRAEQMLQALNDYDIPRAIRLNGALASAIGASGAIMGIFAAFAYLFPNTELIMMFIPIPLKAKWWILGLAAIDLFGGVANAQDDNIAHFAHLGGALTGFILVYIWNKTNRKTFY